MKAFDYIKGEGGNPCFRLNFSRVAIGDNDVLQTTKKILREMPKKYGGVVGKLINGMVVFSTDDEPQSCFKIIASNFGLETDEIKAMDGLDLWVCVDHLEIEIHARKHFHKHYGKEYSQAVFKCAGDSLKEAKRMYFGVLDGFRLSVPDSFMDQVVRRFNKAKPAPEIETVSPPTPKPTPDPLVDALRTLGKPATKHQILATGKVEARQWSTLLSDAYRSRKVRRHESSDAANVYHALA
jgi:hypothetical protein